VADDVAITQTPVPKPAPTFVPTESGPAVNPVALAATQVTPPPPSPVGNQKPPTPRDAADQDDKTLSLAPPPPPPPPASRLVRQIATIQAVSDGIGVVANTTPPPSAPPGLEGRFSLSGNPSGW